MSAPAGPLGNLRRLRDESLDELNALMKEGATPAARQFLDRYALSQSQARSISESLLTGLFGARVRAGVVGGLRPTEDGKDFQSLPISSTSGAGSMDGDISVDDSLASAGKTLGVALGLEQAVVDEAINKGKVVQAAVLPQ